MYGDVTLLNVSYGMVDAKTRISIPANTKVEVGEELTLIKCENYIEIWSTNEIDKLVRELEEKARFEIDLEKRKQYKKQSDEITAFLKTCKVDSLKRITLGKEILEEYGINKTIVLEGKAGYMRLWEESKFLEYINSFPNKKKGR